MKMRRWRSAPSVLFGSSVLPLLLSGLMFRNGDNGVTYRMGLNVDMDAIANPANSQNAIGSGLQVMAGTAKVVYTDMGRLGPFKQGTLLGETAAVAGFASFSTMPRNLMCYTGPKSWAGGDGTAQAAQRCHCSVLWPSGVADWGPRISLQAHGAEC